MRYTGTRPGHFFNVPCSRPPPPTRSYHLLANLVASFVSLSWPKGPNLVLVDESPPPIHSFILCLGELKSNFSLVFLNISCPAKSLSSLPFSPLHRRIYLLPTSETAQPVHWQFIAALDLDRLVLPTEQIRSSGPSETAAASFCQHHIHQICALKILSTSPVASPDISRSRSSICVSRSGLLFYRRRAAHPHCRIDP